MAQVNFRMSSERLAFIDRASAIRGVTRTEFVLLSSEVAAIETLNERPIIALDDEAWDAFTARARCTRGARSCRESALCAHAAVGTQSAPAPLAPHHCR